MGIIKHYFMPNAYVKSVFEINVDKLAETGVKGIITDLDNTLVGWDVVAPTEQIKQWFKEEEKKAYKSQLFQNNNEQRVGEFSKDLNVDFICKARKPMGKAFKKQLNK